jgi:hypothetical protein
VYTPGTVRGPPLPADEHLNEGASTDLPFLPTSAWVRVQAQASLASPSVTGEVDGGMAWGAEQNMLGPGAAAERKAGGRRGGAQSLTRDATVILFLRNYGA